MADNYLEKKMEDRARTAPRTAAPSRRKGTVSIACPARTVVAYTPAAEPSAPFAVAARAIAQAGGRVALLCGISDLDANRRAAQQTGSRLIPYPTDDALQYILRQWGAPDTLLIDGADVPDALPDALAPDARIIALAPAPFCPVNERSPAISNAIHPDHPHPDRAAILLTLPAATFSGVTLNK